MQKVSRGHIDGTQKYLNSLVTIYVSDVTIAKIFKILWKYRNSSYAHPRNAIKTYIKVKILTSSTSKSLKKHYTYAKNKPRTYRRHSKVLKFQCKYCCFRFHNHKSIQIPLEILQFLIKPSTECYKHLHKS